MQPLQMYYYQAKTNEISGTLKISIANSLLNILQSLLLLFLFFFGPLAWNYVSRKEGGTNSANMPFLFPSPIPRFTFDNIPALAFLLFLLFSILRFLFYREEIRADPFDLSIRRGVLGLGKTRKYDIKNIKNLRIEYRIQLILLGNKYSMAFDYENQVVRFGSRISKSEAESLVAKIQKIIAR